MDDPSIQAPLLFYCKLCISLKYLVLKMFPYRKHCPEIKFGLKVRKQQIISSRLLIIILEHLVKTFWLNLTQEAHPPTSLCHTISLCFLVIYSTSSSSASSLTSTALACPVSI